MQEIAVLKAFMDRGMFMTYLPMVKKLKTLEKVHKVMLDIYQQVYDTTDNPTITLEEVSLMVETNYMFMKTELLELVAAINLATIDPDLVKQTINQIVERHYISEIVTLGLPVIEGVKHNVVPEIETLLENYKDHLLIHSEEEVDLSDIPLWKIMEKRQVGQLAWPIDALNDAFGPLPMGHLGHAFAYKETGKTAFGLTLLVHFAKQLRNSNANLVYCCNEENYEITYQRGVSCFTRTPLSALREDEALAHNRYEYYRKNGGMRIRYVNAVHHIVRVKQIIEKYKPMVVFIDQGAKVAPYGVTNLTGIEAKQRIFQLYRELANKHNCTIITLGQGDATTEGKRWLRLNQLDGSKVGIPGELDFAIGIGKDDQNTRRYLNIVANKLNGKLIQVTTGFDYEKSLYYN